MNIMLHEATMSSFIIDEVDIVQQVRKRSFTNWPHTSPSSTQMIAAGFFSCNVSDRVICAYCNLICHQWTSATDDPCEVHKTLSPKCAYVKSNLIHREAASISVVNKNMMGIISGNFSKSLNYLDLSRCNKPTFTNACNTAYEKLAKRIESFETWPNGNSPTVEDLARAGFFYTGTEMIVTCFYCNGSLQNWGSNYIPVIEHARWYPHCAYIKRLSGYKLYQKIQESNRVHQVHSEVNESLNKSNFTISDSSVLSQQLRLSDKSTLSCFIAVQLDSPVSSRELKICDENALSRLVAARLDLPVSQSLLSRNISLSILRRCWEDRLQIKQEDFATEYDLLIACITLKKCIEYIDDREGNIIIPDVWMTKWKEKQQDVINFIEDELTTIEREKSFKDWSYSSPSRLDMVTTGWFLTGTPLDDTTICFQCDARYDGWNDRHNPYIIHRQRSPLCPFIRSLNPIRSSAIQTKHISEVYTEQKINADVNQYNSNVLFPSNAPYCCPSHREKSFQKFPDGSPANTDALVKSGFYYTGVNRTIRCYECQRVANDLHLYPSNEIDTEHKRRFPHCHITQLSVNTHSAMSSSISGRCGWCCKKSIKFAIYPCMCFAICDSCVTMIRTCPRCRREAEVFMKIFG